MASALLALSVLVILHAPFSSSTAPEDGCFFQAMYSFGDSLADTGNLLIEGAAGILASISSLPYGMTFPGAPTGRCSDGLLMIDYFALGLNLPLLPPYLDEYSNFDYGVNFAVAGATALIKTFLLEKGIMMPFTGSSLDVQLSWFNAHINSTCTSQSDCAHKISKSLFFVGEIGGNDYNYALLGGKPIEEVKTYVPLVVDKIITATKGVIGTGAIYLVVPGNFPIGCVPAYLTAFRSSDPEAYDEKSCLKELNSFAAYHNEHLQEELEKLRKDYPSVTIMYADYYNAFLSLLDKTHLFDERYFLTACCGFGGQYNFDLKRICGTPGATACEEPSRRISWDGIHLTQEAYKMITRELTYGGHISPCSELWKNWMCMKDV